MSEIVLQNELDILGVKHVFYSNSNNNLLFISFAGKIDKYVSVSWFYHNELEGNFLFLRDDDNNYTTYNNHKFTLIIDYYINKLNVNKLICYGPSMGAVAAITYGLKFKADLIIAIDPQLINYNISDVISLIKNYNEDHDKKPFIYLNYTFHNDNHNNLIIPHDTKNIIDELSKKFILFLQPYKSTWHLAFIPTKEYLISIIKNFLDYKITNHFDFQKWF